jgi:branched-chain amino acid transport system permease protein
MMATRSERSFALIAAAIVVALILPLVMSDFQIFQATQILVYAIAILGLNLLTGYNGQISLGHGAFYAIGAYAVAILVTQAGMPYWATLPFAALICFIVGFLFGQPALRLEGHYLALATFALALATPQLLKHHAFEDWTGGVQGISILKPDPPPGLPVDADQWLYYFTLLVTIVLFWIARNLVRGRIGRAMTAIRDQPTAAESMGVNVALIKSMTFGVSAMFTGVAGGLSAIIIQFVAPDSFTLFLSVFLLVGMVVGGVGSIPGAFIGAAFIVFVPNVASDISKAATGAVYGVFLIALMYAMPNGVWGALRAGWMRLTAPRRAPAAVAPPQRRPAD